GGAEVSRAGLLRHAGRDGQQGRVQQAAQGAAGQGRTGGGWRGAAAGRRRGDHQRHALRSTSGALPVTLMAAGLLGFFAVHTVPWSPALREALVARMGPNPYKIAFSLIALAGIVLIVMGKGRAPFVPLWQPDPGLYHVTRLLVLAGFILLPAAHMKTNIKRFTRHPMLWGVVLWGAGHLLANGDLASVILFGSFSVF